jgi:hypothetical protein
MMTTSKTNRDVHAASPAQATTRIEQQLVREDYWLNVALEDSFPCSDPISSMRAD